MIYKINIGNGYFDGAMEFPDDPEEVLGIPYGTTRKAPPEIPENHYAVWSGSDWYLTSSPPPIVTPQTIRIRIDSFYDRFGDAKYDILFSNDPEVKAIVEDSRQYASIDLNDSRVLPVVETLQNKGFQFDIDKVMNATLLPEEQYIQ